MEEIKREQLAPELLQKIDVCKKIISVGTEENIITALLTMYDYGRETNTLTENYSGEDSGEDFGEDLEESFEMSDMF